MMYHIMAIGNNIIKLNFIGILMLKVFIVGQSACINNEEKYILEPVILSKFFFNIRVKLP